MSDISGPDQPAPEDKRDEATAPAEAGADRAQAPGQDSGRPGRQESAEAPQQDLGQPSKGSAAAERKDGRKGGSAAKDQPPKKPSVGPPGTTVIVRHGLMRNVGQFRHSLKQTPEPGAKVVVRTDRGVELGEVVIAVDNEPSLGTITPEHLGRFLESCGSQYPLRTDGSVLRMANSQDLIDHRHLHSSASEATAYSRKQIREIGLNMRLVTVEHLLGGERIVFYFTAEQRVDFRELVRRLAGQYRTRIEMRQVGARDEARIIADYERCGLRCCCQAFLKELQPVSMRMAKTQKATLDPSKISGRCGRLMCCLRYEDVCYEELRKKLPKKNTWVRTEDLVGRVIETQILTQLVRLQLPDDSTAVVANEDIVERDVEAPAPQPRAPAAQPGGRGRSEPRRRTRKAAVRAEPAGETVPPPDAKQEKRRRLTEPPPRQAEPPPKAAAPAEQPRPESVEEARGKRRRRRRRPRRKKKGA
ncbi:MAG TPA: regulatory iron-sulfur-containing complex subunit RicT [Phycisphaerae bacterium]|nr:regulatory iron-sulfur-containing complex subunit RicT [Phycisphaerae bacterium]